MLQDSQGVSDHYGKIGIKELKTIELHPRF